jgi:hypothetical protein
MMVAGDYELRIRCVDPRSIVRVIDWIFLREQLGNCSEPHGFMLDPEQVGDVLRVAGLRRRLAGSRLFTYPCLGDEAVLRLRSMGFSVVNYITGDGCAITDAVVIPPNPGLLGIAGEIYVHAYGATPEVERFIRGLRLRNIRLIIDMLHSS